MKHYAWLKKPAPVPESLIRRRLSADLVIVGAGHAGTCAARAAAEAGASVYVIEQQSDERQWVLGIGEMGYMNSDWQRKRGIPDVDVDTFVSDWQLRTNNRSNVRLIRTYAENCGACFDWFIKPLSEEEKNSIHPMMTPASSNMPSTQNGIHAWTGTPNLGMKLMRKAVKENQRLAKELGAEFLFETRAEQITLTDGAVTGLLAKTADESYIHIAAKKGVILAAGDFSKNREMCEDLLAECADLVDEGDITGHGWDGSGICMGLAAGGRLEPRPIPSAGGNYSFPGFDTIGSTASLRLNAHGKRYSNEGFGNHVLAAIPGARQPNGMLWSIFDSNILNEVTYQAPCNASFDYTDPERLARFKDLLSKAQQHKNTQIMNRDPAGDLRPFVCADTIEKLAEVIYEKKEDQLRMTAEVKRYNQLCAAGYDADFGKEPFLLHPIIHGPFYASGQYKDSHRPFGQSMKILVTVGGLLTDEHQNVLGQDFEPIPGLYATGNCSGGRFGLHYSTSLPGQSISMAQTLGREVGQYAALKQ